MQAAAATASAPAAKVEEKKRAPVLMPERIGLAEDRMHHWVVDLPPSITPEDLEESSYWAHVSAQMDPFDHITARAEDGSWIAYLVVQYAERNYARVKLDRVLKLEAVSETPVSSLKYKVDWKGGQLKFCVIRLSDQQVVHDGCRQREDAESWLRNHEKSMGR